MTLLILLSFGIIGAVTVWYTNYENEKYHFERLARKERAIVLSINYYLNESKANDSLVFYTREFHQKVQELADINNLDVNLFDLKGQWVASSDFDFFDLGYIPEVLSADLINKLKTHEGKVIAPMHINDEEYLFSFRYLTDKNNIPIAIVNIPYYRSEKQYKEETKVFLKALVQVYSVTLFLGILIAYLLSNSITKGLKKLEDRIRLLSLHDESQQVEWEGNDEIGSLVNAYNKKVLELERSAQKIAETERELAWREMAKQVAHEIKNPLTPMLLQVQQLERSWKDGREDFGERLKRFNNTMSEQIETLSRIASEFSTFAKLPEAQLEPIKIHSIIKGVSALFHQSGEHEIELNLKANNDLVLADKDQMTRVFTNIIGNAIEAKKDQITCKIKIESSLENNLLKIIIKDNGIGISEETISQIFEPNFTTKSRGTGLGLAMVKRIVQHSGGRVSVKSSLGNGSSFILLLPPLNS
jgi:nitrogen fixation/metabolism regulation signal transduction histidine kinase